jgi:soluble lytic murein transglycosylase-like protein
MVTLLLLAGQAAGEEHGTVGASTPGDTPASAAAPAKTATPSAGESICLMMESAAEANGLPLDFFVRLIWQESRFQTDAVGPRTRNGERASGIAQFMPGTAAERGLLDPLDPISALPKSAEFLRDLRREFGNLGLAAAAYNAGPRRVRDWLAGSGGLPGETRDYVQKITGRSAETWKAAHNGEPRADDKPPTTPSKDCRTLVATLKQAPTGFVAALEHRVGAGASKLWGVELFAGFSRERAVQAYGAIEAKYRTALGGADSLLLRGRFRSRGTRDFYQVRVGADTRHEADTICTRLRTAGAACLVLRNSHGRAETIGGGPT